MFSVLFEVRPRKECFDDYLALAARLKPQLERVDGFIDNERFESRLRPGWLLSHSSWRDEKAVVRWRVNGAHHAVQERGRAGIFEDYHLRVGEVVRDSIMSNLPQQRLDVTQVGDSPFASLVEMTPPRGAAWADDPANVPAQLALPLDTGEVLRHDVLSSITNEGKLAVLVSWRDESSARAWSCPAIAADGLRIRVVRVVRDYSLDDRREAPQYFPEREN